HEESMMRQVVFSLLASRRMRWLVPASSGVMLLALLATPARSQYLYHQRAALALQQYQLRQHIQLAWRPRYYPQPRPMPWRQPAPPPPASRTRPFQPAPKQPPASPGSSRTIQPPAPAPLPKVSPAGPQ